MYRQRFKKPRQVRALRQVSISPAEDLKLQRLAALRAATDSLRTHDLSDEDWIAMLRQLALIKS